MVTKRKNHNRLKALITIELAYLHTKYITLNISH